MEKSAVIERFGGLVKEESLTCLDDKSMMPHACMLEAIAPFSGYYNDVRGAMKPIYLFLVLDGHYPLEKIIRATLAIHLKIKKPFDAAAGSVTLFGHTCEVIRIRDLKHFDDIRELQVLYAEHGFNYRKKMRKISNDKGIIKLRKFFYLEPAGDGLYIDRAQPHHAYFTIPRALEFEEFREVTKEAKYDTGILYFDAAYAWFYEDKGIKEMVRVYRENLTLDKLKAIRDRYLTVMK